MLAEEHIQTARDFLDAADREFADGDSLQGSEKMWGAASHAVMAVAQQRGWPFSTHRAMRDAIRRLAGERDDPYLEIGFSAAEKFHANFYTTSWNRMSSNSPALLCVILSCEC